MPISPLRPTAEIFCVRCPLAAKTLAAPFTEPGRLAGHLVEIHNLSASAGLHEARRAFGIPEAAPRPHVPPAPVLAPTEPQEKNVKTKYKRGGYVCGACGGKGHTARSSECPRSAGFLERLVLDTDPKPKPFQMQDRGQARKTRPAVRNALREEITKLESELVALKAALVVLGG